MAAFSTWWAQPISATAAKMMWPQWVNFIYNWHWNLISINSSYKVFQHKLGNIWSQTAHKHFNSRCKRVCQTLSLLGVVCPLSVLISDMLSFYLLIHCPCSICPIRQSVPCSQMWWWLSCASTGFRCWKWMRILCWGKPKTSTWRKFSRPSNRFESFDESKISREIELVLWRFDQAYCVLYTCKKKR